MSFGQDKIPFIDYEEISLEAQKSADIEDYEKTVELLNRINKNDSTYCSILTSKSYYLIAQNKFEEALAVTNEGLNLNCSSSTKLFLLMNKGVCFTNTDQYAEALLVYDEALNLFPKNAKLWYNKGIAFENLDKIPEAINAYQKAIFYNPIYRNAHLQLGNICYRQNLTAQALMCFNMVLLIEPDSDRGFNFLKILNTTIAGKNEYDPDPNLKVSDDDESFEDIDLVLNNRIALNEGYDTGNKIKIALVKQNHALLEQLKSYEGNGDFWDRRYVTLYNWINEKGYFDEFTYTINYSIKNEDYKKIIKKNTDEIQEFLTELLAKWYEILEDQSTSSSENEARQEYFYSNQVIQAEGKMKGEISVGDWSFYNSNGQLTGKGNYNDNGERDGIWNWFNENGSVKEIATYSNGKLNGENKVFYEDGSPYVSTNFADDKYDGEYLYYLKRGALKQRKQFKNGLLDGKYLAFFNVGESLVEFDVDYSEDKALNKALEYYANGDLYSEIEFIDGERNGNETQYYWNKQKSMVAEYKDDKLNGSYTTFHSNGSKKEEGLSVDGFFDGPWKSYYLDGTLESDYVYSKGELNGIYKTNDSDGLLYSEFQYRNNEIISYKFYDKNGALITENRKKGGEFYYEGYFANGNKKAEGLYDISGGKTGQWKFFNPNSSLSEDGEYIDNNANGVHTTYYSSGDTKSISEYDNGASTGYYQYFYKNGQLQTQGWYKNGQQHGEWRYYFLDGTLNNVNFYHKGETHGKQITFSCNGELESETTYSYDLPIAEVYYNKLGEITDEIDFTAMGGKLTVTTRNYNGTKNTEIDYHNGLKHGAYRSHDFYGTLRVTGHYVNNEMDGEWQWFFDDGTLRVIENYLNGNKNGNTKYYHKSGQLEDDYHFEYGKRSGTWLSYHENGKLYTSTTYLNDNLHGRKEFYSLSGNLQLVRMYNHGTIIGYSYLGLDGKEKDMIPITNETVKVQAFFDNGKPSRTFEYKNGYLSGKYYSYYYSGQIENESTYAKDEYNALDIEYFEDGQIKSKVNYNNGDRQGLSEKFHPNGKLKEMINFKNDTRHGEAKYYDANGTLLKTVLYFNGEIYESK